MQKLISLFILVSLIAIPLAGCTDGASPIYEYDPDKIDTSLIASNTEFAFDIFRELNKDNPGQSVFISPFSISTALAMTYQGARTTTKEGMAQALNYDSLEMVELNNSYQELLQYLNNIDNKVDLTISNSTWAKENGGFNEDFITVNRDVFDAEVTEMDFQKAGAADEINNWIDDATNGKITKMLQPPLPADVVMYLINAIYFKGEWSEQFDKDDTFERDFHTEQGETRTVNMMNRNDTVEYGRGEDFKAVRLPYGNGRTAMYCVLPEDEASINDFIEAMDAAKWQEIVDSVTEHDDVILQIPRFKLEYGIKELNDSLINLGMGEAFAASADFSGIREGIFISRVLHKAVIEVNEEGSEAAAATVVEMTESAPLEEPLSFVADRPFVFFIVDDELGTVLFMGKLADIS